MAVRVIGSWYYTSELPAQEAANLRAAMVSKDCESLEAWLKTYELVALRALCAGERPRARWAGGLGKELFLRSLFAPDLPKELFRKVLSFWAPVWD